MYHNFDFCDFAFLCMATCNSVCCATHRVAPAVSLSRASRNATRVPLWRTVHSATTTPCFTGRIQRVDCSRLATWRHCESIHARANFITGRPPHYPPLSHVILRANIHQYPIISMRWKPCIVAEKDTRLRGRRCSQAWPRRIRLGFLWCSLYRSPTQARDGNASQVYLWTDPWTQWTLQGLRQTDLILSKTNG